MLPCWVLLMGIFLLDKKLHENNSEVRVNAFVSNNILSSFLGTSNISDQCYVILTLKMNYLKIGISNNQLTPIEHYVPLYIL